MGERDLGGRIVHHDDVAHAGRGGAAADDTRLADEHGETGSRAFRRASRAHDSAAGDGDIVVDVLPVALIAVRANAVAEGVALVEDQIGLGVDVRFARDFGVELVAFDEPRSLEDAADDALLAPDLARLEFAVGVEARELGAGAGAAGRAVVRLAGAEDEVLAVGAGRGGRSEQLDVVDLAAIGPGDVRWLRAPGERARCNRSVRRGASSESSLAVIADRKNQLPPQAMSPLTVPMPGTSTRHGGGAAVARRRCGW